MKAHPFAFALLLALPATAFSEDFFDLLEPAAREATRQANHEEAVGPILETPATEAATEAEPETLLVAQAMELIPSPAVTAAPEPIASPKHSPLARPIVSLTLDTQADAQLVAQQQSIPDQFAIQDHAANRFGEWDAPQIAASVSSSRFGPNHFRFAAPAVYSRPLYFEQPNLERYGHHVAWCEHDNLTQSALSAAHFFATVPVMPYKMGATLPDECSYVLGSYRPGSCNPHQLLRPELSVRGLALEGAAVTGLIFLVP